jgi:hypothetical protein
MDIFDFQCPHCEEKYTCTYDMIGCQLICRLCEETIDIPEPVEDKIEKKVEVDDQDSDTVEWEFAQKECQVCGSSLDVLGECEVCKKRAQEYLQGKKKPPVRKGSSGKLFNKAMKARMSGMEGVSHGDEQTPRKPTTTRRRRRRR